MSLKKHTNGPLVYVLAVVAFAALIAAAIHLFGSVPSNAAALVRTANPIVLSVTPPAAQPAPVAASPAAAEPAAARPA
ncbi:MAG: hypothetical protein KC635_01030, partial [Myxococcales bacterium]|nr:hypothetical protein [Myxococcales bacterium]